MSTANTDIAAAFEEIADLLELQQANPFRIRAYRNAARTIATWPEPLARWEAEGHALEDLPGIGMDLAGKAREMIERGTCTPLATLRARLPPGLASLLQVPGIGPKRSRRLYRELGVHSPQQLLDAARAGRIRRLPGFGVASEQRIARASADHLAQPRRWPRPRVVPRAEQVVDHLRAAPGVAEIVVAGSYRRRRDTVGDLDIVVAASDGRAVGMHLARFEGVSDVLAQGATRTSIVLEDGLQVDLRVVRPRSFGAALLYFTGSKAHTIALRRMAQARGMKINEYGVFHGHTRLAGASEASIYELLGLPWITPELREDQGEIEIARRKRLPRLIERADLRGDLHSHTDASDGRDSLEAMALAARDAGLSYLAITDHMRGLGVAHGRDAKCLQTQIEAIEALDRRLHGIALLKGVEVEILPDGRLDMPDEVLSRLDLVVAAIHTDFGLSRQKQTTRILRAMERPFFSMLAHPNGRLFGERGPCDIDMDRVLAQARQRGCFLEVNAQPERLDLFDVQCRLARDAGVQVAVSSDAHAGSEFDFLKYGIDQARRGWLRAGDVINTLPLAALRVRLDATMGRAAALRTGESSE